MQLPHINDVTLLTPVCDLMRVPSNPIGMMDKQRVREEETCQTVLAFCEYISIDKQLKTYNIAEEKKSLK